MCKEMEEKAPAIGSDPERIRSGGCRGACGRPCAAAIAAVRPEITREAPLTHASREAEKEPGD
ncbi:hypothetical protein M3223_11610 [Paenibacillus pasadenensis]|uniref:hypothetical protein n=1 Tax=Paenibacillus pasadenensis TaxID=217090 RepID=UPI00203C7101|nr:hypothetical protein [Paenibacillus pasadenensis]MCM3747998.1 hypothetical protein [Paenibacillus pasadenensis]